MLGIEVGMKRYYFTGYSSEFISQMVNNGVNKCENSTPM